METESGSSPSRLHESLAAHYEWRCTCTELNSGGDCPYCQLLSYSQEEMADFVINREEAAMASGIKPRRKHIEITGYVTERYPNGAKDECKVWRVQGTLAWASDRREVKDRRDLYSTDMRRKGIVRKHPHL